MFGLYRVSSASVFQHNLGDAHLVRISNFLNDVVDFADCEIYDLLLHPLCDLQFFDKESFYVGDNLIAELFGFGGEGLLYEKAAQDPA